MQLRQMKQNKQMIVHITSTSFVCSNVTQKCKYNLNIQNNNSLMQSFKLETFELTIKTYVE